MKRHSLKNTTMEGIGRELGLSAMTISRALNGHPAVREETRQRILDWASKHNYRPNRLARSLVTSRSRVVGIVIPDISHSFFSEITRGVQDAIEREGYDLMLCHSHGDPERELSAIDALLGSRVEGLIVASELPEGSPDILSELGDQGVPCVLLDRFFPGVDCPCVRTDDVAVGRLATEHLIGLGHTRIGHIQGKPVSSGRLREEGYRNAMADRGLPVDPSWVAPGLFSIDGGYGAMQRLLQVQPRLTAIFAGNDPSALGAMRACHEAGIEIPAGCSIAGAGSIEGAVHPFPFLTTVEWGRIELGRIAAEKLLQLIQGQTKLEQQESICAPRLLIRRSTAPPGIQ